MDDDSKKFFQELAGASGEEREEKIIDQEPPADFAADDFKPRLVKMDTVAPATRSRKVPTNVTIRKKIEESGQEGAAPGSVFDGDFDEAEGQLTIDIYQTPDEIVIQSTIAGIRSEDLDIQITSESVTIRGIRRREEEVRDEDYFYQECYWGRFSRSVILPQEIDAEKAAANIKNGVLTIRLPKLNRQKSKKLKVKFV
ncbi:MAG: Hsp20/alpha crystallin family protein [Parcubacteria group bacterium]|nr:Hsp20/alpha crystallin family protein [Parcubacteria group bacterium]